MCVGGGGGGGCGGVGVWGGVFCFFVFLFFKKERQGSTVLITQDQDHSQVCVLSFLHVNPTNTKMVCIAKLGGGHSLSVVTGMCLLQVESSDLSGKTYISKNMGHSGYNDRVSAQQVNRNVDELKRLANSVQ